MPAALCTPGNCPPQETVTSLTCHYRDLLPPSELAHLSPTKIVWNIAVFLRKMLGLLGLLGRTCQQFPGRSVSSTNVLLLICSFVHLWKCPKEPLKQLWEPSLPADCSRSYTNGSFSALEQVLLRMDNRNKIFLKPKCVVACRAWAWSQLRTLMRQPLENC